jgi:hypothetical protein
MEGSHTNRTCHVTNTWPLRYLLKNCMVFAMFLYNKKRGILYIIVHYCTLFYIACYKNVCFLQCCSGIKNGVYFTLLYITCSKTVCFLQCCCIIKNGVYCTLLYIILHGLLQICMLFALLLRNKNRVYCTLLYITC